jgi:hypothetical protein
MIVRKTDGSLGYCGNEQIKRTNDAINLLLDGQAITEKPTQVDPLPDYCIGGLRRIAGSNTWFCPRCGLRFVAEDPKELEGEGICCGPMSGAITRGIPGVNEGKPFSDRGITLVP